MLTLGASGMAGHLDPERERSYAIVGVDLYARSGMFDLHAEYLLRRTEMALGDDPDARFRYGPDEDGEYDDFFLKDGFYVESNLPLFTRLELVGALRRPAPDGQRARQQPAARRAARSCATPAASTSCSTARCG